MIKMLKTFTHKRTNPIAFWCLIALGSFLCVGCQTLSPEVLAERNHRIKEINEKLFDNLQILLSFARQEDVDLELANKALDGVFAIIGHPDSQEVLLAKCLDDNAISSIIAKSMDLKKEKHSLTKANESDSTLLNKAFHKYRESHNILMQLKWIAILLGFAGIIYIALYKPKIF